MRVITPSECARVYIRSGKSGVTYSFKANMEDGTLDRLGSIARASGDETRLRILARLTSGDTRVCHIHRPDRKRLSRLVHIPLRVLEREASDCCGGVDRA
jgi:hypothetical protein